MLSTKNKIYGLQDTTGIFLDNQNQHFGMGGGGFSFVGTGDTLVMVSTKWPDNLVVVPHSALKARDVAL